MQPHFFRSSVLSVSLALACATLAPVRSEAQGCLPIRYTSPTLAAQASAPINQGQWQVGVMYRWLHADRFYVGHDYSPASAPFRAPSQIDISTAELGVWYALTNRFSLAVAVPLAWGTHSRVQDDSLRYRLSESGVGDASLVGTMWLLEPPNHPTANISLSFGVKAPTGQAAKNADWHQLTGIVRRPVDPSIQLGDGGWGAIARTEFFRQIATRAALYGAGSYLANPRSHIAATFTTPYGVVAPVAVADEYSAHAGVTLDALPGRGVSFSLGERIDGVPVHDLIGSSDGSFRRPGYVLYAEPALGFRRSDSPVSPAGSSFTISVPIRMDQNRKASTLDIANGKHGGGDFARFLVFLGYSRRW